MLGVRHTTVVVAGVAACVDAEGICMLAVRVCRCMYIVAAYSETQNSSLLCIYGTVG